MQGECRVMKPTINQHSVGFVTLHPPYITAKMGSIFIGNSLKQNYGSYN